MRGVSYADGVCHMLRGRGQAGEPRRTFYTKRRQHYFWQERCQVCAQSSACGPLMPKKDNKGLVVQEGGRACLRSFTATTLHLQCVCLLQLLNITPTCSSTGCAHPLDPGSLPHAPAHAQTVPAQHPHHPHLLKHRLYPSPGPLPNAPAQHGTDLDDGCLGEFLGGDQLAGVHAEYK